MTTAPPHDTAAAAAAAATAASGPPPRRRGAWLRSLAWQLLAVAAVALLFGWLGHNTVENMRARGIQGGFDFLWQPAGFSIGETPIAYDAMDVYARAFLVGLVNTLRVAVAGIVLATLLGAGVGIGRLADNALLRGVCTTYVEAFRNVPLLLQLLMGYLLLTETLPDVSDPAVWAAGAVSLSKAGLSLALPGAWDGGSVELTPECMAVLLGLVLYTAAYIAEVVRAGIQSVPRGQLDAADALGLTRAQRLRAVVLPQALRVIVPPLSNQYLNLTKNSSLAVAIGYPDVVSIANTALNQTGRAVECIAIVMAVYLALSLATSAAMNAWNRRVAVHGR